MAFPKLTTLPWYARELLGSLVSGVPTLLGGFVTVRIAYSDPSTDSIRMGAGITVVMFSAFGILLAMIRGHHKDKEAAKAQTPKDIEGCVHVLHSMICATKGISRTQKDKAPRITIWRVVSDHEVEQVIAYVGGAGGKPGRRQSSRSGIVGRATTCGEPVFGKRINDDYEKFVVEMRSNWHFSESDARELSCDRFAWAAIPLPGKDGQVEAVVFIDSEDRDFFKQPNFKKSVIEACTGISEYVRLRY